MTYLYHGTSFPVHSITGAARGSEILDMLSASSLFYKELGRIVHCSIPAAVHKTLTSKLCEPADRVSRGMIFPLRYRPNASKPVAFFVALHAGTLLWFGAAPDTSIDVVSTGAARDMVHIDCLSRDFDSPLLEPFCLSPHGAFELPGRSELCNSKRQAALLFSFALRMHCSLPSQAVPHMYEKTLRLFLAAPARTTIFADGGLVAALIIARFAPSATVRNFCIKAVCKGVDLIARVEYERRHALVQLHFVLKHLELLRAVLRNDTQIDEPIEVRDAQMVFRFAKNWDLLVPTREAFARGDARLVRGDVWLTPGGALRLLHVYTQRVLERVPCRTGKRTVELASRGVDLEYLASLENRAPIARGLFADGDRPTDLDDLLTTERRPVPLAMHRFSLPEFRGMQRPLAELSLPSARWFFRPAGQTVPARGLLLLMTASERDGTDSVVRAAQQLTQSSSLSQEMYAQDEDGAFCRDRGFERWFMVARKKKQTLVAAAPAPSSSQASSSPTSSSAPDIEDLFANVYMNGGMPPCQRAWAHANVELGQHPKDDARVNYYPYLRSLKLPYVDARHATAHMLRNDEPGPYANDQFRQYRRHKAELCRKTLAKSVAGHQKSGKKREDAVKLAACSAGCRSMAAAGRCPFSVARASDEARLKKTLLTTYKLTDEQAAEIVSVSRREGRQTTACRTLFATLHPNNPFPAGGEVRIYHPRDYTYLCASHAARTRKNQQ